MGSDHLRSLGYDHTNSGIFRWGQFNPCAERFGDWSSLQIWVRILWWCHWLEYDSARREARDLFFTRQTEKATAMAGPNFIQKLLGKGRNEQGETLARFPKDEINAWHQRLLEKQVRHLQAGDILLKMNFTMDAAPVANVISTGQRILQSYEKEGSYASGHVAIALDGLRVAEQTGAGVSINTLGVTDTDVAAHKIDTVYYYVFRCTCRNVSEAAAKLAESFTTGSPLANRTGQLQHDIGGNYALGKALGSVFKPRSSAIADPLDKSDNINIDDWSQNVLDFCTGKTHVRKDMFCSAFVLAVYQAACKYLIEEEKRKKMAQLQGGGGMRLGNIIANKQYRGCILPLVARNTTPRTYEQHLRRNPAYNEEGAFRYVDLDEEHRAKEADSRILANFSQAIDNYANFVTTGKFGASGSEGLKNRVNSLIKKKSEETIAQKRRLNAEATARLSTGQRRFQRFFGAPSKGEVKPASQVLFGSSITKEVIQQMVTLSENEKYQNLKRTRDSLLSEQYAQEEERLFFSMAVLDFSEECTAGARDESILGLFLSTSLDTLNKEGLALANSRRSANRSANRSARRL